MTAAPAQGLVHLLGRADAGDPTTASARSLSRHLAASGGPVALVAVAPAAGCPGVALADEASLAGRDVVVHTVDGGEPLADLLPRVHARSLHLVHHGSRAGSDRSVLRRLRGATWSCSAVDPSAREELRSLGFGRVDVLPRAALEGGLDAVVADEGTAENVARHPGPRILAVGPIEPGRSLELLIDAFAHLVAGAQPSATLSLCGPSSPWYAAMLRRRILARGLVACELATPVDERAVVARLDHAHAVVALHPAATDPYLRRAADRGVPVVAPLVARTAWLHGRALVGIPAGVGATALAEALDTAIAAPPQEGSAGPAAPAGPARLVPADDVALRRILAIG